MELAGPMQKQQSTKPPMAAHSRCFEQLCFTMHNTVEILLSSTKLLWLPHEITVWLTLEAGLSICWAGTASSFQQYRTALTRTGAQEGCSGLLALGAPWQGRCSPHSGALDQKWINTSKSPQHAAPMCYSALESKLRKMFYFFPCCHLHCPQKQILLSHLISQTLCRHLLSESQTWQHPADGMGKAAPAQWCFCNNYWTQRSPTSFTLHPSFPLISIKLIFERT